MGQKRTRDRKPARLILLALTLAGVLAFSAANLASVAAETPPVGAGPNAVYAPLILKPVAEWTTIMTEGFEGGFTAPGWDVFDRNGTDWGELFWGADDSNPYAGAWSAWPGRGGADQRDPYYSDYADNMSSWMVFGPFSLAGAARAEMSFRLWNQSEAGYDNVAWLASTNNSDFYGQLLSGDTGGWQPESLNLNSVYTLGNLAGQPQVWIAFVFASDGSNTAKGPFVDAVLVRKSQFYLNSPSPMAAGAATQPVHLTRPAASPNVAKPAPEVQTPLVGAGFDRKFTDIRLINTDTTTSASVDANFYTASGVTASYTTSTTIPRLGGASINQVATPLAVGFTGGAQLSSPQAVLGIINIGGLRSMMGYTAPTAGATTVYLPAVFNNAYGVWTTNFSVQNTTATAATVTMVYHDLAGAVVYTATDTIPAYASHLYDQGAMTALIGASFVGSVEITSTQAVTAQVCEESPVHADGAAYTGIASAAAATTVHASSVLKNAWGWYSDIRIQNPNPNPTDVTVTFYDSTGAVIATLTDPNVPAHGVRAYNEQAVAELGPFFAGSAVITSTLPVAVVVNEAHTSGALLSYEGVANAAGTTTVYAPSILKNAWGWVTDLRIRNTGATATNVTIDFYTFAGTKEHTIVDSIPGHGVKGYNQSFITQLSNGWQGWALVTSDTHPVTAIVNEIYTSGDGIAYTAINR